MMTAWDDVTDALAELRRALVELEAIPDSELDEPTLRLRANTRALLDRLDGKDPEYDPWRAGQ